jgi:hypothetical protein
MARPLLAAAARRQGRLMWVMSRTIPDAARFLKPESCGDAGEAHIRFCTPNNSTLAQFISCPFQSCNAGGEIPLTPPSPKNGRGRYFGTQLVRADGKSPCGRVSSPWGEVR